MAIKVQGLEPNYYFFPLGSYSILYLLMYKSTFYSLKITPKNSPQLIHGSKTEFKKRSGQIFHVTIVYLKENSKIRNKFFKKILFFFNLFFGSKMGGCLIHGIDLYMGKYLSIAGLTLVVCHCYVLIYAPVGG